jgi:hypothetical protein
MKLSRSTLIRIAVCVVVAVPMLLVETGRINRRGLGLAGYIALLLLYWIIQAASGFRHPLHGSAVVLVIAILYWLILPGWVHSRVAASKLVSLGTPNQRPALDARSPLGLHSGRDWPGASDAQRWVENV